MIRFVISIFAVTSFFAASGCSDMAQVGKPDANPQSEIQKPKVRQEVFEPLYRIATELKAGQEVGMNREKFGTLLQQFATELTIATDKAESPEEQQICSGYSDVLSIYKDAGKVWDVQISVPSLKYEAQRHYDTVTITIDDDLTRFKQLSNFKIAIIEGIPLNVFPSGLTGLDDIAAQYVLPVKEDKGWKTIPRDSVQLIWAKAREKNAEVDKLRKS